MTVSWTFAFQLEKIITDIAISQQRYNRSPWNLAKWCRMGLSGAVAVKNLILTTQDGDGWCAWETDSVHHDSWDNYAFSIFKIATFRHLALLKLKFLTAVHSDRFCISMPRFEEIAIFRVFSGETCKFTRWSRLTWHNFVNVWIIFGNVD